MRRALLAVLALAAVGCVDWSAAVEEGCAAKGICAPDGSTGGGTGGGTGGATEDAGLDSGTLDSGTLDAGTLDSGTPDAGTLDSGTLDSGTPDSGTPDSGTPDAGTPDSGTLDAGSPDAGLIDAGPDPKAWTILVADMANHRLVSLGAFDGGGWLALPATSQALSRPQKLAFDDQGRILIADTGNSRILRMDDFSGTNQVALGTYGNIGTGDPVPPPGMFMNPISVWMNPQDQTVYVVDTFNNGTTVQTVIDSFLIRGTTLTTWRGFIPAGASAIYDVTSAPSGDTGFYACYTTPDWGYSSSWANVAHFKSIPYDAGTPSPTMSPDRSPSWNKDLALIFGCALDTSEGFETMYAAYGPTLGGKTWGVLGGSPKSTVDAAHQKAAVTGGRNYGELPALPAPLAQLNAFGGMGLDSDLPTATSGYIYLADRYNHRIVKTNKDMSAYEVSTLGSYGQDAGQLATPSDVKVGPDGGLYIADTNNDRLVRVDDINGAHWTTFGSSAGAGQGQFHSPRGVTTGPDGGLYVADTDNHRIVQMSDPSGAGWLEYHGAGIKALVAPTRIKVTSEGIWVLDPGAAPPRVVFMTDLTGAGFHAWRPGTVGDLKDPRGLEIDANGHLFIADTGNNRLVEVDDFNAAAFYSGAVEGALGTKGTSTGQFNAPADLALSPDGLTLVVADSLNNRLVKLAHPANAAALAATGWQPLLLPGPFTSAFNRPSGVTWAADGRLYVTDTSNHRLLRLDTFSPTGVAVLGGDGSGPGQFVQPYGVFVR